MRNRWLPLGLLLLLALLLLTPAVQDFIRDRLVTPLLYAYWIGRFLFEAIPQAMIWGAFIVVALFITLGSLFKHRQRSRRRAPAYQKAHEDRIETWLKLLHKADREIYYKWQMAQQLRKLTVAALAHDERVSAKEIQRRLSAQQLDLPPEIEAYLQAGQSSFSYLSDLGTRPDSPLALDPERVVEFLEARLS